MRGEKEPTVQKKRQAKRNRQSKKKEGCLTTTCPFINLKSNTMKNTVQRYTLIKYVRTCDILFCCIFARVLYLLTNSCQEKPYLLTNLAEAAHYST